MRTLRLLLLLACLAPAMLRAQVLYWDTNGSLGGAAGDGTWDLTSTLWTTDSNGLTPTITWSNGAAAVFVGFAPTTITLGSGVQASTLSFQAVQYTLTGGTELTLTGAAMSSQYAVNLGVTLNSPGLNFAGDFYLNMANPNLTGLITNTYNLTYNHPDAISNNAGTSLLNQGQLVFDYVSGGDFSYTVNNPITFDGGAIYVEHELYANRSVTLTGAISLITDARLFGGPLDDYGLARLTSSGVISGVGSNVKVGGEVTLSGTNTFTGKVIVGDGVDGRVKVATFNNELTAGALGAGSGLVLGQDFGPSSVNNGEVVYTGGTATSNRTIEIVGNTGAVGVENPATTLTLTGVISSSGSNGLHDFEKTGPGALVLKGANTFAGNSYLTNGTLIIGNSAALGSNVAAELELGTSRTSYDDDLTLLLENGITLSHYVDVYNENNDGGSTTLGLFGTGTATFAEEVYIQRDIDLSVGTGGTLNFTETFSDGSGGGGITKIGAGRAVFTGGIDLRGGGLNLQAGELAFSQGSVVLAQAINVGASATLAASGLLTSSMYGQTTINVDAGGKLSVGGDTAAVLTTPGLHLLPGSDFKWQLASLTAVTLTEWDRVVVDGLAGDQLQIDSGAQLTVDLSLLGISSQPLQGAKLLNDPFWQTAQVWVLIDFTGAGTNTLVPGAVNPFTVTNYFWPGGVFDTFVGGGAGDFAGFAAGDVFLRFTPVPEPSTYALLGLGAAALLLPRRRRR